MQVQDRTTGGSGPRALPMQGSLNHSNEGFLSGITVDHRGAPYSIPHAGYTPLQQGSVPQWPLFPPCRYKIERQGVPRAAYTNGRNIHKETGRYAWLCARIPPPIPRFLAFFMEGHTHFMGFSFQLWYDSLNFFISYSCPC